VHGRWGKIVVIICMFIVQFGACVGYLYFVAKIADEILCDQVQYCQHETQYKLLMLIITIPLSLLKSYTYLSYVSMVGIACALVGGFMMIGYCSDTIASGHQVAGDMEVFNIKAFFGYIGIAMFAFEGNGVVINLKAEARDKNRYPVILQLAILSIIVWYMTIGTLSYATFKAETGLHDYVTSNLPLSAFTIPINIFFCINTLTSYPIQILCAFEIIEEMPFFQQQTDSILKHNIKLYTERIFIILVVTAAAIYIPRFVDFLNIAGSLGAAALGFIFPPLYYISSCGGLKQMRPHLMVFNLFLILFGTVGAIYSLYTSIKSIVERG
jgi:amino acid permease